MSVERHQTVLEVSLGGVQRAISEAERLAQALDRTVRAAGGQGGTATGRSIQLLGGAGTQAGGLVGVDDIRPGTFNPVERARQKQQIAMDNAANALTNYSKVIKDGTATAQEQFRALQGLRRASVALDSAIENVYSVARKFDPSVQQDAQRLAQARRDNAQAVRDETSLIEKRNRERRGASTHVFGSAVIGEAADKARIDQAYAANKQELLDEERARQARNKIREAEIRAAFATSSALSPDEVNRFLATPTRMPGDSDRVYSARKQLAEAELHATTMDRRMRETARGALEGQFADQTQAYAALNAATQAQAAAVRRVTTAEERLERALTIQAQAHAVGQRTSVRESFLSGFRGRGDNAPPYAEQLGQAFKFSLFYGTAYKMLFALTQTLTATYQEAVQWEESMTNLRLATDRSHNELEGISHQLAEQATRAGFAPSQGLEIGARSLGLYGAIDADSATQERVMLQSARVVNQLAVGSPKTPVELQGDIAAIAQALGMGAQGQFRIADLDAYMTKKFGVQQGSTLEVVAQSASVGKAAGFSDEQLFAIAADLLSRTGQSESAVSGYMAQIFSRGGEGSLVDVARKQGIDPNQDLAQILAELARTYQTASGPDQAEISAAFGRGKIQNAAVALLSDYDEVLQRSGEAMSEASGQADKQFRLRMDNIGGQVELLMGVMREFASLLGQSGMLDVLGLAIVTFRELLEMVNGLLKVWNLLPDVIQDTILAFGALIALAKTGAIGQGANSLLAARGTAGAVGQFRRTAGGAPVFVNTAGRAAPLLSGAGIGGLARAGTAALGLVGPIGIAITGLLAIGALKNSADRMGAALETGQALLTTPSVGYGSTPSEYQAAASEMKSYATENREATGWLAQALSLGTANDRNIGMAERLEAEANRLEGIAARMSAEESRGATPQQLAIRSLATDDVAQGLQALEAGGATAQQRLRALNQVLFGTAAAAEQAANSFSARDFAERSAGDVIAGASEALKGLVITPQDLIPDVTKASGFTGTFSSGGPGPALTGNYGVAPITMTNEAIQRRLTEELTGQTAQRRLRRGINELGIQSEADLTPGAAEELAGMVGAGMAEAILPKDATREKIRSVQKKINAGIAAALIANAKTTQDLISGDSPLTIEDATNAALQVAQLSEGRMSGMAEIDTEGRVRALQGRIRTLRRIQSRTSEPIGVITEMIGQARRQIANERFTELERLRRLAQRDARSKREIADIGQRFMRREIRAAIRGGDADLLVNILEQAGKGAAAFARQTIENALKVINQSIETALLLNSVGQEIDGVVKGAAAGWREGLSESAADDVNAPIRRRRRELRRMLRAIEKSLSARGDDNVYGSGSDSGNPLLDKDKEEEKDKDSPAEIAAARAAAFATRSQSQIASARAAIMSARASLADAKKNTVEYWNAMGELFAAQQALTEAVRAFRINQMRLGGDITNPLFNARVATREAAMRLRQDRASGAGADVLAQDRIDLREARANQEATRFSQRLQAVQTAEELGRISHSKYMNYLENEKRRLEGIKNRTFQQQEQLDQIDRLMKDAATQMQGQFNLGDIKLPTPYQVRRYIEQTSPARTERLTAQTYASTNLTINAYGANPPEIEQTVRRVVGKKGRVRTAAPRRR
jgi:TP901 family phage tail tape measure protein